MYLRVIREYRTRSITYPKGVVLHVTEREARFFQMAAPGHFEVVDSPNMPALKDMDAPPADTMLRHGSAGAVTK